MRNQHNIMALFGGFFIGLTVAECVIEFGSYVIHFADDLHGIL